MIKFSRTALRYLTVGLMSFTAISCQDDFEVSSNVNDYFHVKNGDYPIPVLVRGNTASRKILLYVQGGPGYSSLDFAKIDYPEWKNTLEKDFAVAYYDQRGTGNKQGNFSLGESVLHTWIEDLHAVAAFLREAYQAEIIMMGHSFGGQLVYRYILEKGSIAVPVQYISMNAPVTTDNYDDAYRWLFRREFLVNTAELEISRNRRVSQWNEVKEWLDRTPVIYKTTSSNPYELMDQWNKYVEELVYIDYQEKNPKLKDYLKVIFFSNYNLMPHVINTEYTFDVADKISAETRKNPITDKLAGISNQSLLMITGRYDDICPPEELEFAYNEISSPNKQMSVLDYAGHDSYVHQPEQFHQIVKQFITNQ
jgi:pimeloyl-ACP methyl ester carboxylesterase